VETDALCEPYSAELWFPPSFDEEPTGTDTEYYEVAKMVCSVCPSQAECRSVGAEEKYGVWGGTTPPERRKGKSRPSKRLANRALFDQLPPKFDEYGNPFHIRDMSGLYDEIRSITKKRPSA